MRAARLTVATLLLSAAAGWRASPAARRRGGTPVATLHSPFPAPGGMGGTGAMTTPYPVKVMVFIDGTWLYYSIHGRRPGCPVTKKYGVGWELSHSVAFDRLAYLISHHLHTQLLERHHTNRFVEVSRTLVFTSARKDTNPMSQRLRMFREMEACNFDVHMSVTAGQQEKCIDISLAVEMMHYASTEGAYDVAVLLSGDKDFMPALSRIRYKGKQVALCSMRNCCSRDLVDPAAHVRDFEPIWLDDYLDYLIVPNKDLAPDLGLPHVSASQLLEMVTRLLKERGGTASSRDIGRYLQGQMVHGRDVLSQVKQRHAGLRAFFQTFSDEFEMFTPEGVEEPEFMVRLAESDADEQRQEARLMTYKGIAAEGEAEADDDAEEGGKGDKGGAGGASGAGWAGEVGWADAQRLGVTELRPLLRRLGLSASGRKAELLDRLGAEMEENGLEANLRRSFEEAADEADEADEAAVGLEEDAFFGELEGGEAAEAAEAEVEEGEAGVEEAGEEAEEAEAVAPAPRFRAPHRRQVPAPPPPPVTATATAWGYPGVGGRFNGGSGVTAWDNPAKGSDASSRIPPPGYPARSPASAAASAPTSASASASPRAVPPPPVPAAVSATVPAPPLPLRADEVQEGEGKGKVQDGVFEQSIADYLTAEGGEASSRNVGRQLAAKGLLRPLKGRYAGLFHFLQQRTEMFTIELPTKRGELEYRVALAQPAAAPPSGRAQQQPINQQQQQFQKQQQQYQQQQQQQQQQQRGDGGYDGV